MSVEKFITIEPIPYVQLSNEKIKSFNDVAALGLWAYIQSLNTNTISISELAEHFGISLKETVKILEKIYPSKEGV